MKQRRQSFLKRPLIRILIIWAIQAIALIIMSFLMDSVWIENVGIAIAAAAVIGLLNALLWPLLSFIIVPFAVFTLGLAALLMNGAIVWLTTLIVDGFQVDGFWAAFWLALGMAVINIILSSLLTIDDDNSWSRNVVKRQMRRNPASEPTNVPGILFLEIDGLSKPVLEKALEEGYAPTLKRWLDEGSHELTGWETDTSSQTSASQAGILHGNNTDIPAFRWYDKEKGMIIASSDSKILPDLEKEHSDGNGLLSDEGASRGNLLSGDAPYVMTTASTIKDTSKFHAKDFQAYFASPYNVARTLILFIWDIIIEKGQFRRARKNNVTPIASKHKRGGIYPVLRAFMTVLMRELNINTLLGDIFAGRPAVYSTFVGYDEVAHHSGIFDPGAFDVLYNLDAQFARLESATGDAPRPYHLVVLSDHGQTGGSTFKQRYGMTLQEYVQELMAADVQVGGGDLPDGEGSSNINFFLADTIQNEDSGASKLIGRVLKGRTVDGEIIIDKGERDEAKETIEGDEEQPEIYALASGNLGLVSFTQWSERMTLEEINEAFPAVIPGLAQHEGVGFLMVATESDGSVVIGAEGRYYLEGDRIEGENPLALFGSNAAQHLRRTNSFPNCPDILVNSFYDPETNEGCAFEELIGFHGGMGGYQTQPFVLHPSELKAEGELVGAASIYHLCKGWLQQVQNDAA